MFLLGVIPEQILIEFTDLISQKKVTETIQLLDKIIEEGFNSHQLVKDLIQFYRNMLIVKISKDPKKMLVLPDETINILRDKTKDLSSDHISWVITILNQTKEAMKWSEQSRIVLEVNLFKLCQGYVPIGQIMEKIEMLEKKMENEKDNKSFSNSVYKMENNTIEKKKIEEIKTYDYKKQKASSYQ